MYKSQLVYKYLPFSSDAVEQEMARRRVVMELIQRSVNQILENIDLSHNQGSKIKLEFKIELDEGQMDLHGGHRTTSAEFSMIDMSFVPDQVNPNVEELFRRLMRIELSRFSYNGQDRSAAYRY